MEERQCEEALRNQEDMEKKTAGAGDAAQAAEDMDALEEQRIQRRRERMAAMRRRRRRKEVIREWALVIIVALVLLLLMIWGIKKLTGGIGRGSGEPPGGESLTSGEESREDSGEGQTGSGESREDSGEGQTGSGETRKDSGEGQTGSGESREDSGNTDGQAETPSRKGSGDGRLSQPQEELQTEAKEQEEVPEAEPFLFRPMATEHTAGFPEEGRGVYSTNGILIDVESEVIIAQRDPYGRISPASMTKILTLLVAAEHVTELQDTFTITREITDYSFQHDCSNAGFAVGEVVTVEDLLYGTVLPSGADAALGLAEYVAGSQEAFVELMNQKLEQMGLSDSAHFTNCIGLYDEEHYCTVYDMAMILKAASDNELCRKILSAHTYTTSSTAQHPEGLQISNWFLRRIEDKDTHGEVLCAKTGFVNQSGNCAASLATDHEGREYLCVTTGSISGWACIYDHVEIYQAFLPK